MKWFYAAFIVINLVLTCYFLDVWLTPNAASRAMPVLSLYEDKTLVIDKYKDYAGDVSVINGHTYSNKAPFSSFIVYPFYALYKSLGLPELKDTTLKEYPIYIWAYKAPDGIVHTPDGRTFLLPKSSTVLILGDILCGAIPFIIALFLSLVAMKRTSYNISPVIIVMLSFYASFLFAYSGTYTGHLLSGIFALTGYIFIKKKNYLFSGIMVGLALATEFPVGILVPVWALLIFLNEKKFSKPILFGLGLIPGFMLVLWYNYHLTGSFTKTPYNFEVHQSKEQSQDIGFNLPSFSAFWGLVFSTFRGVLFYTPVLLFMLWYAVKSGYQNTLSKTRNSMSILSKGIKNYLLMTIVAYLILYSAYYQWPGGWAFGPRYLIPMVMIVLYEGVIFLSSSGIFSKGKSIPVYIFYTLTGLGLLFTWMDKSTKVYMLPDDPTRFGNPLTSVIFPDFTHHLFNSNLLPVFLFDSSPIFAVHLWLLLFLGGMFGLAVWYNKLNPAPLQKQPQTPKGAMNNATQSPIRGLGQAQNKRKPKGKPSR